MIAKKPGIMSIAMGSVNEMTLQAAVQFRSLYRLV
jgi:hypothetical protein